MYLKKEALWYFHLHYQKRHQKRHQTRHQKSHQKRRACKQETRTRCITNVLFDPFNAQWRHTNDVKMPLLYVSFDAYMSLSPHYIYPHNVRQCMTSNLWLHTSPGVVRVYVMWRKRHIFIKRDVQKGDIYVVCMTSNGWRHTLPGVVRVYVMWRKRYICIKRHIQKKDIYVGFDTFNEVTDAVHLAVLGYVSFGMIIYQKRRLCIKRHKHMTYVWRRDADMCIYQKRRVCVKRDVFA